MADLMIRAYDAHRRNDIQRAGKAVRGFKGVRLIS
jgi:hypothetical protein